MKKETIRNLIYQVLSEAAQDFKMASAENMTSASRLSKISVDSQIDSYMLGFEKESVMSADETIAETLAAGSLSALLQEVDPVEIGEEGEEEGEEEEAAEEEEEEEVPEPGDESENKAAEPAKPPMPRLNV